MSGHHGIIQHLLAEDKARPFSKVVMLSNGQSGRVDGVKELAHYLGLAGHSTLAGDNAKIAAHNFKKFAELYCFTDDNDCMAALRSQDDAEFRSAFERLRDRGRSKSNTPAATPIVWNPPTTKDEVLARIEAMKLEELAGAEVGEGHIAIARDSVTLVAAAEGAARGLALKWGAVESKLKGPEVKFAGISFSGRLRNDARVEFPLKLGVDLDLGGLDDSELHVTQCDVGVRFSGIAATHHVGERKRLDEIGRTLVVTPERSAARSKLKIKPYGPNHAAGWSVGIEKGPLGSVTGHDLVEVVTGEAGDTILLQLILPTKWLTKT